MLPAIHTFTPIAFNLFQRNDDLSVIPPTLADIKTVGLVTAEEGEVVEGSSVHIPQDDLDKKPVTK